MSSTTVFFTCQSCGWVKERDHFTRHTDEHWRDDDLHSTCYTCDLRRTTIKASPYYLAVAELENASGECYTTWINTSDPRNDQLVVRMRELAKISHTGKQPLTHGRRKKRKKTHAKEHGRRSAA